MQGEGRIYYNYIIIIPASDSRQCCYVAAGTCMPITFGAICANRVAVCTKMKNINKYVCRV